MPETKDHDALKKLLEENITVTKENNEYLRKIYRNSVIGGIFTIVWYALLIGLPFALYHYVIDPYFRAFGANPDVFRAGMEEVPGFKGFEKIFP